MSETGTGTDAYQETLQYSCVCGDGQTPDLAQYSLTIPFYECQTYGNQCVKACGLADNACSDKCRYVPPTLIPWSVHF